LDFKTLPETAQVNQAWRQHCKTAIRRKCGQIGPKAVQSNRELRNAVKLYCTYQAASMEEIACTYEYFIGIWVVPQIEDMFELFMILYDKFNEGIGSWDVSNVTSVQYMFNVARTFVQDIGSWDEYSVRIMECMLYRASEFNQDIRSWDVSSVASMPNMFTKAFAFNQDFESWA
jgi:hypothetical protein